MHLVPQSVPHAPSLPFSAYFLDPDFLAPDFDGSAFGFRPAFGLSILSADLVAGELIVTVLKNGGIVSSESGTYRISNGFCSCPAAVNGDCPEYLRQQIAHLHCRLMSEFNCDVSDDIRLRFALGAQKAAEGHRPAG